jgi:putative ABC transport system substrate-binding protein
VVLLLLLNVFSCLAEELTVLIVSPDEQESTVRSLKGIRQTLDGSGLPLKIESVVIGSAEEYRDTLRAQIERFKPDVLVTIGSRVSKLAGYLNTNVPIVFASVLNPVTSGLVQSLHSPGGLITGASLDIDVKLQLERFKKLVPSVKRLGVLFTQRTQDQVELARSVAASLSIEVVPYEVTSPKDVPLGLDSIARSCHGIWAVPDELIYTPQSVKHIILESFRNRIPVMGFSPSFVQSGALFALIVDQKFVGVQAGELAVKILKGASPSGLPVTSPEAPYLYINRNTAEKLGLSISADYYSVAKEVYE